MCPYSSPLATDSGIVPRALETTQWMNEWVDGTVLSSSCFYLEILYIVYIADAISPFLESIIKYSCNYFQCRMAFWEDFSDVFKGHMKRGLYHLFPIA